MKDRGIRRRSRHASGAAAAVALWLLPSSLFAQTVLPDINVIAPTPLSGHRARPKPKPSDGTAAPQTGAPSEPAPAAASADPTAIDRDKVPSSTSVLTSADFSHETATNFLDSLNRGLPGVSLGDQTGNPNQKDVSYRGFTASPVQGTPQGIAVYQNGTRINESWGDVVNWNFIPEKAIDGVSLFPSNPVFGLNAIGGALSIQMKNGFTYQGTEFEAMGGSFGRAQSSVQAGRQYGNIAAYGLFESGYDKGWRDLAMGSSHTNHMYADVGARNEQTEFHVSFTGANDILHNVGPTPLDLLNQKWSSVWSNPQTTNQQLAFLQANLSHNLSDTLSFQGNVYYRGFWQSHVDGNGTDAFPCAKDGSSAASKFLCIGDGDPIFGDNPVLNPVRHPGDFLGEIDRNWVSSNTVGGTAQFASANKVFEHDNRFVVGASLDHGYTQFSASSELATIDPQTLFTQGLGVFINQPMDDFGIVNLHAINTYTGFYATDTFDVTGRLSITAGARFNIARINLQDQTGVNGLINGNNQFQHLNPMIGATYKITPNLTAYADYAIANRAPTPLELGCSDPNHPCQIDNFLVADPPLKQVVTHTIEGGLRGTVGTNAKTGRLTWSLGVFDAVNDDDIINVAATLGGPVANFGFFQNFGKTERKGVEAKVDYVNERWKLYANYTLVDATYQSAASLNSPNNPNGLCSDANGNVLGSLSQVGAGNCGIPFVNVVPGDHIGGIPEHRFKAGAEYAVTDKWKVGADLNVVGSQYLVHDDGNQFA
ncbi:MAG: TonB-dependent receptor, partial [Bradyrhizobiaceae bacterium]|nr:TonB-dependent receptor [Bradyrhizobiaceae bacterium]